MCYKYNNLKNAIKFIEGANTWLKGKIQEKKRRNQKVRNLKNLNPKNN